MADKKYDDQGGSKCQFDLFRLEDDVIVSPDGTALEGARAANLVISLQMSIKTSVAFNEDGTMTITPENVQDNEDFWDFLEDSKAESTGSLEQIVLENGSKLEGTSGGRKYFGVWHGNSETKSSVTKVHMFAFKGSFSKSSGSFESQYGQWNKPTVVFNTEKALKDIAIPAALLDATILKSTDITAVTTAGGKFDKIAAKTDHKSGYVEAA